MAILDNFGQNQGKWLILGRESVAGPRKTRFTLPKKVV
jgi:hypothetical protein